MNTKISRLLPYLITYGSFFLIFLIFGSIWAQYRIKNIKKDYYSAHWKFSYGLTKYGYFRFKKNINENAITRYGDLCNRIGAKNGEQCPFFEGERKIDFKTDDFGFRTNQSLKNSNFIMIGDSFLSANGGDFVKDQLGGQLGILTGKEFYEASHPNDIPHYFAILNRLKEYRSDKKIYMILIYEGNDLRDPKEVKNLAEKARKEDEKRLSQLKYKLIKYFPLYKLLKYYYLAYREKYEEPNLSLNSVVIKKIGGRNQAFYKEQNIESLRDSFLPRKNDFLLNKDLICGVYFIPTAYSVYLTNLSLKDRHPTLARDFKELENNGIEFIDLTKSLRESAYMNPNLNLWWADDTHWNKNGIAIAAKTIKNQSKCIEK